jgi:hypothetical protein
MDMRMWRTRPCTTSSVPTPNPWQGFSGCGWAVYTFWKVARGHALVALI